MAGTHVDLPLALGPALAIIGLGVVVLVLATYDAYRSYEPAEVSDE